MNNYLISVIVPIYNVEKYLDRCVQSLLRQTYRYIEIILVDDGSPDSCPQLCDEYKKQYNNIVVIHQNNKGLAGARNSGIQKVNGDFITFVDSDDWIAPNYYDYCINKLVEYNAEVIQIDYSLATDNKIYKTNPAEKIQIFEGKDVLQYYLSSSTATGSYSVCRCLFSKHLIGDIRFREGKINEDIDWKYKVLNRCKRFISSNQVMYFYYQSGNSISSGGLKRQDFQLREAAELLRDLTAKEDYGTIRQLGEVKEARTAFSLLCKIAYFGIADPTINKKQIVEQLTSEHRGNYLKLLNAPIPFSRKVLSIMFAINYKLTETLIKLIKNYV